VAQLSTLGHIASRMNTPIIVVDGARVTVDGVEILVIRSPEKMTREQFEFGLEPLLKNVPFPFVLAHAPSGVVVAFYGAPAYTAKFDPKIHSSFQWTKVPIYATFPERH